MHRPRKTPAYRLHRPTGQAVVTLDNRDRYLGKFDPHASHEMYHRLMAEWSAGRRIEVTGPTMAVPASSVADVILAFWRHAQAHYRHADGTPTGEGDNYRLSLRPLRKTFTPRPRADV